MKTLIILFLVLGTSMSAPLAKSELSPLSSQSTLLKRYTMTGTLTGTIGNCTVSVSVTVSFEWNPNTPSIPPTNISVGINGMNINCGSGPVIMNARIVNFDFDENSKTISNVIIIDENSQNDSQYTEIITSSELASNIADYSTTLIDDAIQNP